MKRESNSPWPIALMIIAVAVASLCWLAAQPADAETPNNGCTIECGNGQAVVECPVHPECPDSTGAATLTVKAGKAKSVSPCGCCTKCTLPPCVTDGVYTGTCANHLCTYTIVCNCGKALKSAAPVPAQSAAQPLADAAPGQAPNLVVSAGPTGQAASLTITSDSNSPWKCFTVSGSAGAYNVIWAESNGTTGGIYFGSIATSSSGNAGPGPVPTPPPAPSDLPIGTLTTAVSAAVAGVDQATAATMANTYESLAKSIDTKIIVSPLQLQLATGTQLLANFSADQLGTMKNFTAAVCGWMDGCQCSGKLSPERMDRYAKAYHAIAQAIKPGIVTPAVPVVKVIGVPPVTVPTEAPPKVKTPCENGQCPYTEPSRRSRRGR